MTDFSPGPGWREIESGGLPQKGEAYVHWAAGPEGPFRDWVREAPVPPLPTAPYTVIRVTPPAAYAAGIPMLYVHDGTRYAMVSLNSWLTLENAEDAADFGVEVLSEPRAVTAKAVLGRLLSRLDAEGVKVTNIGEWIDMVGREFGVES